MRTLKAGDIIEFGEYTPKGREHERVKVTKEYDNGAVMLATMAGVAIKGRFSQAEMDTYEWEVVENN